MQYLASYDHIVVWGRRTAKKMVFDIRRIKSREMFREGLRLGSYYPKSAREHATARCQAPNS